jgi:hypothetical protein
MKSMTPRELNEKIKKLKAELKKEIEKNGYSKRAIFLNATLNQYAEKLFK